MMSNINWIDWAGVFGFIFSVIGILKDVNFWRANISIRRENNYEYTGYRFFVVSNAKDSYNCANNVRVCFGKDNDYFIGNLSVGETKLITIPYDINGVLVVKISWYENIYGNFIKRSRSKEELCSGLRRFI